MYNKTENKYINLELTYCQKYIINIHGCFSWRLHK